MPKKAWPKTSVSDPIRVDFLPLPSSPGRVGLTVAPGRRDGFRWERSVAADLDRLVQTYGASHLISLIEDEELVDYRITDLFTEARRRGLIVERFPIPDASVPPDEACVTPLVERIGTWLARGATVVIHCIGGMGRSGTIAGCVLVSHGLDAEAALGVLRQARDPVRCPETERQRDFVRRYAQHTAEVPDPLRAAPAWEGRRSPTTAADASRPRRYVP